MLFPVFQRRKVARYDEIVGALLHSDHTDRGSGFFRAPDCAGQVFDRLQQARRRKKHDCLFDSGPALQFL